MQHNQLRDSRAIKALAGTALLIVFALLLSGREVAGAAMSGAGNGGATVATSTEDQTIPTSTKKYGQLYDMAYTVFLSKKGEWIGPRKADGSIDLSIIDDIIEQRRGFARPKFLRMTTASNDCPDPRREPCWTGVPAEGTKEYEALRDLKDAGMKIGVAINVYRKPEPPEGCDEGWDDPTKRNRCIRPVSEVVAHAKEINDTDGNLYDYIFLDFAPRRTPAGGAGVDDLQEVVDRVRDEAGWARRMTNATGFSSENRQNTAHGMWGDAKRFEIFRGADWKEKVDRVLSGEWEAIRPEDMRFINFIEDHRPDSYAILKLEVPGQVRRFGQLASHEQEKLLRLWARGQAEYGYKMMYPLFIHGNAAHGDPEREYDSRDEANGTFWMQRVLMERYDDPGPKRA